MQQFAGADALPQAIFGHSQGETELSGVSQGDHEALGEEQGFQGPELELDAEPEEVVRRIQSAALWFISQLAEGVLPDIELVSRTASNRALTAAGGDEGAEGNGEEGAGSRGGPRHFVLRLQQGTQCRSLVGRHPESAEQVARLWVLLGAVHAMLLSGEQATQRELWYRFKTLEVFRSPRDVNEAIQDAVSMLQVPRSALAITASSKGLVGGRLVIHNRRSGTETDCSLAASGVAVPGDVAAILQDLAFQTDAQLILVVEKDAVFQRLLQQKFFDRVPSIICTGKGMPDLATRAYLSSLSLAFPHLPVVGLVDWNPAGVSILSIYRFGSHRMGLESPHYALPALGWLGAHSSQLRRADADAFQELSARDRSQAASLAATLEQACPCWAEELRQMLASGAKAELEALDTAEDLLDLLERCILEGGCI
ncbi:hypothetical protein ABPG77_008382 [Micractinium sp. CCAP 211/92]